MKFTKMHGCGNDFILLDEAMGALALDPARVRALCDRRTGIGADGILVVGAPSGRRWPMAIHNSDGSVAESCGNGSRCAARLLLDAHGGTELELATAAGVVRAWRDPRGIAIELGAPVVGPKVRVRVGSNEHDLIGVRVGNANLVAFVDDPGCIDLGALARSARALAGDANVGAAAVNADGTITLRVDERGAGETLACGTGACAAVAAAVALRGVTSDTVHVRLPGGTLEVRRGSRAEDPWVLAGPAEYVYRGDFSV